MDAEIDGTPLLHLPVLRLAEITHEVVVVVAPDAPEHVITQRILIAQRDDRVTLGGDHLAAQVLVGVGTLVDARVIAPRRLGVTLLAGLMPFVARAPFRPPLLLLRS